MAGSPAGRGRVAGYVTSVAVGGRPPGRWAGTRRQRRQRDLQRGGGQQGLRKAAWCSGPEPRAGGPVRSPCRPAGSPLDPAGSRCGEGGNSASRGLGQWEEGGHGVISGRAGAGGGYMTLVADDAAPASAIRFVVMSCRVREQAGGRRAEGGGRGAGLPPATRGRAVASVSIAGFTTAGLAAGLRGLSSRSSPTWPDGTGDERVVRPWGPSAAALGTGEGASGAAYQRPAAGRHEMRARAA